MTANLEFCFVITAPEDKYITSHTHNALELVYYVEGRGKSTINGKTYTLKKGFFSITPAGTYHDQENVTDMTSICVGVSGSGLEELTGGHYDHDGILSDPLKKLVYELDIKRPFHDTIAKGLLIEITGLARRAVSQRQKVSSKKEIVERAEEIIRKKQGSLTVADLASNLYVSRDYLRHLFAEYSNKSPMRHIISARIENARDMLSGSDLKVSEIAKKAGFENAYYFSRLFKKVTGLTPTAYRKKGLVSDTGPSKKRHSRKSL